MLSPQMRDTGHRGPERFQGTQPEVEAWRWNAGEEIQGTQPERGRLEIEYRVEDLGDIV